MSSRTNELLVQKTRV